MNKIVYCDFLFLKDFLKSRPKYKEDPMEDDAPMQSWKKMYQFICASKTHLNISQSKYLSEAKRDVELIHFHKRCTNLRFSEDGIDFFDKGCVNDIEKLNSVYFSSRNKIVREELSKELGIIVLGKQDISKFEKLFRERTIAIPKNDEQFKKWSDIDFPEYRNTANSLIIIDNYVLKAKIQSESLLQLLDILLPEKLNTMFHLSIYTYIESKEEVDDIIMEIKKLRQSDLLDIKIVVCRVGKNEFHDRIIISNNMWIDCGSGFDLFTRGQANKRTNIRFAFPFMMNPANRKSWENEAYIYLIKDLLQEEKPSRSHTYTVDYWGNESRDNRLLTYYKNNLL